MVESTSVILVVVLAAVIAGATAVARRTRRTAGAGPAVPDEAPVRSRGLRFWSGRQKREEERQAARKARIENLERTIAYYEERLAAQPDNEFFMRWATEQRGLAEQELERLRA